MNQKFNKKIEGVGKFITLSFASLFVILFLYYIAFAFNMYAVIDKHRGNVEKYTSSSYAPDGIFDALPSIKYDKELKSLVMVVECPEKSINFTNFFVRTELLYRLKLSFSVQNTLNLLRCIIKNQITGELNVSSRSFKVFFNNTNIDEQNLDYSEVVKFELGRTNSVFTIKNDTIKIVGIVNDNHNANNALLIDEIIKSLSGVSSFQNKTITCEVAENIKCTVN